MINQAIIVILFLITNTQCAFEIISSTDYAQIDFAVALLKEIGRGDGSIILSPISISTALFMISLAAYDESNQELRNILGRNAMKIEVQRYFGKLLKDNADTKNDNYTLNIANRLYVRQEFPIQPSFPFVLQFHFGETLHKFTYERKDQLAKEINNWISKKTNRRIKKLLVTAEVYSQTEMLVFSTIYYKSAWKKQFISDNTENAIFHISQNESQMMPMMLLREELKYYDDSLVKVVTLPYADNKVEMLKLPKFGLETELNLKNILKKFGITNIFSENAKFERLSNNTISISDIIHRSSFEINEKGTEITNKTEFYPSNNSISPITSVIFNANQPFLYFIVRNSRTILYAGQCGRSCKF